MGDALDRLETHTRKEVIKVDAKISEAQRKLGSAVQPEQRAKLQKIIDGLRREQRVLRERLRIIAEKRGQRHNGGHSG